MKNKLQRISFTIAVGLLAFNMNSQQIGNGMAPVIDNFTIPLNSGCYNAQYPIGTLPENNWQHLFVVRHPNGINNYQLQIASSIADNDKLYFRKLASASATAINPNWYELATRGTNNFIGNQIIDGNIGVGTPTPNSKLTIRSGNTGVSIHPGSSPYFGTLAFNREAATGEIFDPTGQAFQINNGGGDKNLHFQVYNNNGDQITENALVISGINGNIGIGISNPINKLDVNGTIHSKEVKVDLTGWSDFVFKNEYDLPTLEEVEKHIIEKGHLKNIPSEEEVLKNGINLGGMNAKLLQKIEELTLYSIEQNKKIEKLQEENKKILEIEKRLEKIEKS